MIREVSTMLGQEKLRNALLGKRYSREGDQIGNIEWKTQIYYPAKLRKDCKFIIL